jgi:hypothetical protein
MLVVTTCFRAAEFEPAAQKDQILGIGTDQMSHLPACNFELLLGHLTMLVDTGRVSIHFK